jgi:hypothetical protein
MAYPKPRFRFFSKKPSKPEWIASSWWWHPVTFLPSPSPLETFPHA